MDEILSYVPEIDIEFVKEEKSTEQKSLYVCQGLLNIE